MRKTVIAIAGATGLVAALAGCAQVQEPAPICNMAGINASRTLVALPAAAPDAPSPLMEMPLNSVSVVDHAIIQKVFPRQVTARRTPTGTVEVVTQIVNCTDHPLNVEARTQFYDGAHTASEPVSAWKRFAMPARSSNTYRESSIGAKNVNFYMVELRETR